MVTLEKLPRPVGTQARANQQDSEDVRARNGVTSLDKRGLTKLFGHCAIRHYCAVSSAEQEDYSVVSLGHSLGGRLCALCVLQCLATTGKTRLAEDGV